MASEPTSISRRGFFVLCSAIVIPLRPILTVPITPIGGFIMFKNLVGKQNILFGGTPTEGVFTDFEVRNHDGVQWLCGKKADPKKAIGFVWKEGENFSAIYRCIFDGKVNNVK